MVAVRHIEFLKIVAVFMYSLLTPFLRYGIQITKEIGRVMAKKLFSIWWPSAVFNFIILYFDHKPDF